MSVVTKSMQHPECDTCAHDDAAAREIIRRAIDSELDFNVCGRCLLRLTADQRRGAA